MEESPGQRIVRLRLSKGWNQQRLAAVIGVGQSAVSAWENDENPPSRDNLYLVAKALGVSVDELGYPPPDLPEPLSPIQPAWFEEWAEGNADQLGVIQKQLLRIEALLTDQQVSSASAQAESQHP